MLRLPTGLALALLAATAAASPPDPQQLIYASEGNRLRRFDADSVAFGPLVEDVHVENAGADPLAGRDVNGMVCRVPDGSGRFVMGEDTGQPTPPAGWGVFAPDGAQVGKLTATYAVANPEPFGCAFDASGRLFTTETGNQGFGTPQGQLILWFPPYDVFPGAPGQYPNTNAASTSFCKIATDISTASGVAIDAAGNVYVAATSGLEILRFAPPFPTAPDAAGGCGLTDAQGSPLATSVTRTQWIAADPGRGMTTYSGIAIAPNGNLWVASVLTGKISEYDPSGTFVRFLLDHSETTLPFTYGTPQGLAVGADGSLYYADLDLVGTLPNVAPGPNGKVRRIAFDANADPLPPTVVRAGLAFPDGLGVLSGDLEPPRGTTYGGGLERRFFDATETTLTAANVGSLAPKWSVATGGAITASPTVAEVRVPGAGHVAVAYAQSWDGFVYAVRVDSGTVLWQVATEPQPGATFGTTASVDVTDIDGVDTVLVGAGEILHALDAASGTELWRFTAGTGCRDAMGIPPGLCGPSGERNEIESSVAVAGGLVVFGMDVDDDATGKGGVYALDARDGRMRWFFDLESGSTCRPFASDEVRRYDGYHSESELGLPAGFLATRPGCDHPRTPNGCGNVWSSPAVDLDREAVYLASSNCDTDTDPGTNEPPPPMPPYDEAIFALRLDGTPLWRWRPREVDNADLAFGAPPNLFRIDANGALRDVVGVGNKDGTYYVLDRDGVNEVNGLRWDDPSPANVALVPYWTRNVVPGGNVGGILAGAAVDETARRIFLSTAPGDSGTHLPPAAPQKPTHHALDLDDGSVLWDNGTGAVLASFGPTSAIPGVAFFGSVPGATLTARDATTGTSLLSLGLTSVAALASAPAFHEGTLVVGEGIGPGPTATSPSNLAAFCAPGTTACSLCGNGTTELGEGCDDGNLASGDGCWSTCVEEDAFTFAGTASGGSVRVLVAGVAIDVPTTSGESAAQVAATVAAAVNAHPELVAADVVAVANGATFATNTVPTDVLLLDSGLSASVPALPAGAATGLAAALAALGAWAAATGRRSARR